MTSIIEYKLPRILEKYGKNWENFRSITDDELKRILRKIYYLYRINDVSTMDEEIINYELNANDIGIVSDNINAKKSTRRGYVSTFKIKGNQDVYLDIAESIVGVRGIIFSGTEIASFRWDYSTWPEGAGVEDLSMLWPGDFPWLEVWINVKTSDMAKINDILDIFRKKIYKPAFMKLILTDDTLAILGVV